MKLVSRFQAASCSTAKLHSLLGEALLAFSAAARGSQERCDVLESIRNIENELATRAPGLYGNAAGLSASREFSAP